jgi:hypothetical protein
MDRVRTTAISNIETMNQTSFLSSSKAPRARMQLN